MTPKAKEHIKAHNLHILIRIGGVDVYSTPSGDYICFVSDLDVCTDGSGDDHGDDFHLSHTAYTPDLNADVDRYIVIPPQVRMMPDPVVLGCQGRITRIDSGHREDGVIGEIGPDDKTGETAICLAQIMNPAVSANSGDSRKIYFYELWPGKAAYVNGKHYKLLPAG
jgi:hypothetical protein